MHERGRDENGYSNYGCVRRNSFHGTKVLQIEIREICYHTVDIDHQASAIR
jgi:hypothetical protein